MLYRSYWGAAASEPGLCTWFFSPRLKGYVCYLSCSYPPHKENGPNLRDAGMVTHRSSWRQILAADRGIILLLPDFRVLGRHILPEDECEPETWWHLCHFSFNFHRSLATWSDLFQIFCLPIPLSSHVQALVPFWQNRAAISLTLLLPSVDIPTVTYSVFKKELYFIYMIFLKVYFMNRSALSTLC